MIVIVRRKQNGVTQKDKNEYISRYRCNPGVCRIANFYVIDNTSKYILHGRYLISLI